MNTRRSQYDRLVILAWNRSAPPARWFSIASLRPAALALPFVTGCVELPPGARQELVQAEKSYRSNDYAGASTTLDRIIETYPLFRQTAEAYYLRALCRTHQSNRLGAASDIKHCLDYAPPKDIASRAHATAATLAFEAGNYADACEHYQEALDHLPESPPTDLVRYRYGLSLQRMGDWRAAKMEFAAVYQRYPESSLAATAKSMFDWPFDHFVIQCGVFRDRKSADRQLKKLQQSGLSGRVNSRTRGSEVLYMVYVGSYTRYDQAQEALPSVRRHVSGAVVAPA